ncbi:MAG: hypothetical protein Q7J55_02880 [bacterium]|nr:hypothetical protein [bacterium]
MQIGLMGAWNTDSGASIHTELVGRSLIELGHKIVVFSFFKHSFHGTAFVSEDEDYVTRCFTVPSDKNPQLLATPFLRNDYEIFVVEDLGMLLQDHLGKIFHWIKRKAKTINVIHDGDLKEDPSFYQFDWDAIVCFDKRYYDFLKFAYPEEIIHIIPHPCLPWRPGDKEKSRKELGLPPDKKIVLLFGPASEHGADKYHIVKEFKSDYPILILVVTKHEGSLKKWREIKHRSGRDMIEIREETPSIEGLYEYLYASDLLLYNKPSNPGIVTVASTAFQCLGSGCPMVTFKSSFVETLNGAVYKYENNKELRACIASVFEKDRKYEEIIKNAEVYIEKNSAINVAKRFVKLFESLRR